LRPGRQSRLNSYRQPGGRVLGCDHDPERDAPADHRLK
jgi:hypothetical protein